MVWNGCHLTGAQDDGARPSGVQRGVWRHPLDQRRLGARCPRHGRGPAGAVPYMPHATKRARRERVPPGRRMRATAFRLCVAHALVDRGVRVEAASAQRPERKTCRHARTARTLSARTPITPHHSPVLRCALCAVCSDRFPPGEGSKLTRSHA